MNLLDLPRPARRRRGIYWTSVIASIVVHGGFLAYVLAYARPPAQPQPQPRFAGINVDVIGTTPSAALRRGDREDVTSHARLEDVPPRPEEDAAGSDAAEAAAAMALASQLGAPLPEDGARAVKPFPLPERLPKHRLRTNPAVAGRAPAIATPRAHAGTVMSVPARRLSRIAREARLSERRAADPQPDDVPDAMPLPPLELLAVAEKQPVSEESRASALDMGAQGSPVVAVLPKEAGIAMFAARITDGAPMLPEDRSATPVETEPERTVESRPVALPSRRVARRAVDSPAQGERGDPDNAQDEDEDARDVAGARKARAYRANVRAHLAGNKPAGAYGSGRAVVAFNLSHDGRVRSVRISRSSGSPTLDQAVLKTIYRAVPFPKPPKGLKRAQLRFLIPFEFR